MSPLPASLQPMPKRRRTGSEAQALPVFVCEYHDEALRCLHWAIRKRRLPLSDVSMVHLDAHPDLGAPMTFPARKMLESPHDLYFELRKDPGGIAQWILPAVYAGHLSFLWWVRPSWAVQIQDGDYHVSVGRAPRSVPAIAAAVPSDLNTKPTGAAVVEARNSATVAAVKNQADAGAAATASEAKEADVETVHISCSQPYFVEDDIYCAEEKLIDPKPLRLLVSQLGLPKEPLNLEGKPWTLDVCLDYFACRNPFLRQTRSRIAVPFAALQLQATFRSGNVGEVQRFKQESADFDQAYKKLLAAGIRAAAQTEADNERNDDDNAPQGHHDEGVSTNVSAANALNEKQEDVTGADEEDGDDEIDIALKALAPHLPAYSAELLEAAGEAIDEARKRELEEILAAGDMITLPVDIVNDEAEIRRRIDAFEKFLIELVGQTSSKPSVVTIARSVVDGFCPMRWQTLLETSILEIVERHFGALDLLFSDELDMLESEPRGHG